MFFVYSLALSLVVTGGDVLLFGGPNAVVGYNYEEMKIVDKEPGDKVSYNYGNRKNVD